MVNERDMGFFDFVSAAAKATVAVAKGTLEVAVKGAARTVVNNFAKDVAKIAVKNSSKTAGKSLAKVNI